MRKCTSRLGSGRATTDIIHTVTTTRTAITGRITTGLTIATAGIDTIVTTVIINTIGTKLTYPHKFRSSWLEGNLSPGSISRNAPKNTSKGLNRYYLYLRDSN